MQTRVLSGALWGRMTRRGAAVLDTHHVEVNDLNVFPIPDGDTGDNMLMTLRSGCEAALNIPEEPTLSAAAGAVSSGMLLGARGNSGVILSRIFAGIAKGLDGLDTASPEQFAKALFDGVDEAYASVANPVEGTILTVFKDASRAAKGDSFEDMLDHFLLEASESLSRTPELLAVLKEAGVVDSGGAGLIYIFEGMREALGDAGTGNYAESLPEKRIPSSSKIDYDAFGPDSQLEFGYCTEFLLRLQSSKVSLDSFDENEIRDYLQSAGESVVCFRDGSVVKAHVHTFKPGDILNHCQRWGEYLSVKVENMTLQHNGAARAKNLVKVPRKRYAVVAVASGEGLVNAFRECGVEEVIEGGQTMNPSSLDFINAFKKVNADTVFVFPNNSNIILAAQQAASMYSDSDVIVLPCKSIGAGYVAAASLDRSLKDPKAISKAAMETVDSVVCGLVSKAVRDIIQEGLTVKTGDFIGFERHHIISAGDSRTEVALSMLETLKIQLHEVAVIFYGENVTETEANSFVAELQTKCPRTEIILSNGAQPVYDYIIALC